ncbi:hypothetical protein FGO68_gene6950 [Halteria grandinella]|uniref:Major facilitator superfamily (MFS) profile domain-containing protein n=1 Tax=Halteria grandinella TaxID=5974 RepID=A0A8J8SWG2_HALGN|nr:hypothetical protein FGO68_gene6950 [Halteria grandinella]
MKDTDQFVERYIRECNPGQQTNSRFHRLFVTLLAFNFGIPCIFIYGFGFFELMPSIKCLDKDTNMEFQCERADVCGAPEKYKYIYDQESYFTVSNWIIRYDLLCMDKNQIGYFGGILLTGFFIGSVFFVRLGDILGRKAIVLASTIVSTFASQLAYIFIFGVTIGPRCFLSYVLAMELTPKEMHAFYSTMAMLFDSMCMIFLGVYFYAVRSMEQLILGLAIIQIVICVLMFLFIPESPKFLFEQGKKEQFITSLKKIAIINGLKPEDMVVNFEEVRNLGGGHSNSTPGGEQSGRKPKNFGTINGELIEDDVNSSDGTQPEMIESAEVSAKSVSMINLVKDPLYALNTAILAVLWSTSAYSFYFTEFYMKYVPVSNVYYLAILMGCSDLFTSLIFNLINRKLSTKQIIAVSTLLLSLSATVLTIAIWVESDIITDPADISLGLQVFFSVMVLGMRFFSALTFISVYFANNEYFPTLLKGAIFAVTNVAARLASVMSPMVAEWMGNPSITVAIAAIAACIGSFKLTKKGTD